MSKHQEQRSPFIFFILTIAYSWLFWLPFVLEATGIIDLGFDVSANGAGLVAAVGGFGPLAAAITLVTRRHGREEAWRFFSQVFAVKAKSVYYLLALLVPLLISAGAHYLAPLFNLQVADTLIPEEVGNPWLLAVPYFIFILLVGGGQEEWGWRGYAQQPLQERLGVLKASLMIGFVWGIWHLPLWFFSPNNAAYSFLGFLIHITAIAVVYGWIYNASGQKLIIPLLFHAMANTAAPLWPYLHGVRGEAEHAYWVFAFINVLVGLAAAYLIRKKDRVKATADTLAYQAG